ncbi:response regulator transcription factor [Plastorhodobacter daqingensis]|uniref:Response regulator transcription factor n=1 Tax=Plastorhodobacter daqingensis TaxID=1387281 RepID=A0ABW2UNR4_9RHOB
MNAPPEPIRLLVADDHDMVIEMISMYLSAHPDIEVEIAKSLDEALEKVARNGPFDILLLDYNMPGMNGMSGLTKGLRANGGKPVAILTGNPSRRLVEDAIEAGAAGVIPKTNSVRSLANAIRFINAGEQYIPLELMRDKAISHEPGPGRLSEKEMLVLSHLAEGKQNKVIANELKLAEATVKMHVKAICKKLGVTNRTQAVIASRDRGII